MKKESVADRIYSHKTTSRISKKIKLLGSSNNYDLNKLLVSHLIISFAILVLFTLIFKGKIILSLFLSLLYFFLTEYFFFDLRIKKRSKQIERDAILYFQILALTLESGNNLKNAIEITSRDIDSELSNEFRKVIDDVSLGKSLTEALNDMKMRIPSDSVNNIILNLLESNIYGNNMLDSLNNQLDYLNEKILLNTKERINKMPIKISITSVLLFVPLILIILLTPVIIQIVNS